MEKLYCDNPHVKEAEINEFLDFLSFMYDDVVYEVDGIMQLIEDKQGNLLGVEHSIFIDDFSEVELKFYFDEHNKN